MGGGRSSTVNGRGRGCRWPAPLNGRGSGGKDLKGARDLIGEHVGPGVGGGESGERATSIGGGAAREAAGRGRGWGIADDWICGGASGRNDRRLEDNPVVCNGREWG